MKKIILSIIALLSLTLLICSSACCKEAGAIPDNTPVCQDKQRGTSKVPADKYIDVKGIKTRYWKAGDKGPVVLLIHGFGASVEIWQHNICSLAKSYRVYAIDLVGFGRSDKPDRPYNVSMMTEFVDDFMKAAGIDKASLVGLSFGGGISLLYALQYPQKVEKLVLVDSVGLGTKVNFLVRLMSLPIIGELATKPNKGNVSRFFKLAVLNPEILNEEFIETYCKLWSLPGAQQAILKVLRSICTLSGPREDVLNNTMPKLHKITASTLIVWGKQDALLPVEQAYFAKERIPNSQLHVFDQCGHMPNFEKPAEFNSVVLDFLTK